MGKHSKGLMGERPRTMHDICAPRKMGKKKDQEKIKMRSLEQLIIRNKPERIQKTIRELEARERAGKLDHNDQIKLIANKHIMRKKREKMEAEKNPDAKPPEFRYTPEQILRGQISERGDALIRGAASNNPAADLPDIVAGFEPNSSYRPTGLPSASNFVSEGCVTSQHAVNYQDEEEKKPRTADEKRKEADPLTSERFESELLFRIAAEEDAAQKAREQAKLALKPAAPVPQPIKRPAPEHSVPPPAPQLKKPAAARIPHGFVPASVRANKRKKEEKPASTLSQPQSISQKPQEGKRKSEPAPAVATFKNVSNVPMPENLLLLDMDEEEDVASKDYKELIADLKK